jgi:hypothetical protein
MAKSAAEGTFASRILIMLFALAVVILGAYPIRQQLRRHANDIRALVRENLPELPATGLSADSLSLNSASGESHSSSTFSLWGNDEDAPPVKRPKNVVVEKNAATKQQLDRLSPDDRKQLSELVNSF